MFKITVWLCYLESDQVIADDQVLACVLVKVFHKSVLCQQETLLGAPDPLRYKHNTMCFGKPLL